MSTKTSIANAVGGKTARACDSCVRQRARWYCAADDAFLCQSCDSTVHSANPLARRHQRLRLNSSSSSKSPNSPSWLSGFTRKPRTRRRRPKPDDLLSLVPEADEATSLEEEDHLLYQVPTFDPFHDENQSKSNVADESPILHGFLPSDLDLAEFAADVESLLGGNMENECFDMEGLGIGLGHGFGLGLEEKDDTSARRVKVENNNLDGRLQRQQYEAEVDRMNFEDYEEKIITVVVGVKNEREEDCNKVGDDELKVNDKTRKVALRLDCDAVIAAWGNDKSPWTNGERPHFHPDDSWLHPMAICGVSYGHTCGEYGVSAAAMGDGGREARVSRYREKRRTRLFSKKIRYEVRKLNAEKRPRMKGRFVKRTPFTQPTLPIISIK